MSETSPRNLVSDMESIIGKENVSDKMFDRITYSVDPMPYDLDERNIAAVVVKPASAFEVSEILRYANKYKIPVYTHGSGTLFQGVSRPKRMGSIVLHTGRMSFIKIYKDSNYFECGPGAKVLEVERFLTSHGYFLPLNPGSKAIGSIGGAISTNTIGHMVDLHVGKPVDHVMGVEVVLPTGEVIETGTKSMRRPAGIDLTRIFVGGEGQFGVITKIRMHLIPNPERVYVIGYFDRSEAVPYAFMNLYRQKAPLPIYGEFLDEETAKIGYKLKGLSPPKGSVALSIVGGRTEDEASKHAEEICKVFRSTEGSIEAKVVEDPNLQAKLWGSREAILHLIGEHKGQWVAIEVAPELSHLADVLIDLKTKIPETLDVLKGQKVYFYGHVGACSVHALWIIPREWSNEQKKLAAREAFRVERELHIKYTGCSGELGVLSARIPFVKQRYGEAYYLIFLKLKELFDPSYILNPGNIEGEIG